MCLHTHTSLLCLRASVSLSLSLSISLFFSVFFSLPLFLPVQDASMHVGSNLVSFLPSFECNASTSLCLRRKQFLIVRKTIPKMRGLSLSLDSSASTRCSFHRRLHCVIISFLSTRSLRLSVRLVVDEKTSAPHSCTDTRGVRTPH